MLTISKVPEVRQLSIPATHNFRFDQETRLNVFWEEQKAISRTALESLAPLNIDIPASATIRSRRHKVPTIPHPPHLTALSHLAELEALLGSSSSALKLLYQLREEVGANFPSPAKEITHEDIVPYDFGQDFKLRNSLNSDVGSTLGLDFGSGSRYAHLTAELSTLSLDEAKCMLSTLSTRNYESSQSKFDSLKDLLMGKIYRWTYGALSEIPTLPNTPAMHMPNISVFPKAMSDLLACLSESRAAFRGDLSPIATGLASFVVSLVGDDADGDVSWEDARWKGLITYPPGSRAEAGILTEEKKDDREDRENMHTVALEKSQGGRTLIRYLHLPERWRNNEFVWEGYRFIPGAQWPALVLSMFQLHNETVNIQTHFIPLLAIFSLILLPRELVVTRHPLFSDPAPTSQSGISLFGFTPLPPSPADPTPKFFYLLAASACLACSTIWHTLAGCSDLWLLEAGARIDYVGIGWLISASVSGVVYYGFACQPVIMRLYISITIVTGVAGTILPFQAWFDERKNKVRAYTSIS